MKLFNIFMLSLLIFACENDLSLITVPAADQDSLPGDVIPVPQPARDNIEGIYRVSRSDDKFGTDVVLKWNGDNLSVFTGQSATYLILQSGCNDSAIFFTGYWRAATGSATGLVNLQIRKHAGASALLSGTKPDSIVIEGFYGKDNDVPTRKIIFIFDYPFKQADTDFYIIGHRGGGRTIDRLPYSENSLGMIKFAGQLGANAIEIDVKRTSDGVPVLFHDTYLNKRLINEDYFTGKISDYTFAQLRTFCTLIHGEQIPTLEEALKTVLEQTRLKLVWLDIKDSQLISCVAALQQEYLKLARESGRDLEILIGIPDAGVLKEFININNYENIPSLCELKAEDVSRTNARVWAPRWSLGLLNEQVTEMHAAAMRVFIWTLDDPVLIKSFFKKGEFDGFVTNYPSLSAYEYYRKK